MQKEKTINKYIKLCFIIFISLFFGIEIAKNIFPNYEFAIYNEDNKYYLSSGISKGLTKEFICITDECNLEINGIGTINKASIKFRQNDLNEIKFNNTNIKTYKLKTNYQNYYENITFFTIKSNQLTRIFSSILISLIFLTTLFQLLKKESYLMSNNLYKVLEKKHIIISFIILFATILLVTGSDAMVISTVQSWFADGHDVYQIQNISKTFLNFEYAEFPYNPISIIVYGGLYKIFSFILNLLPFVKGYPYFQVFYIKFINYIFIQITILSLLNYLYSKKKISKKQLTSLYYLSFLNPISFYVAFIYVQIDCLSLMLFTLGFINIERIKESNYISLFFLAIAVSLKMQLLVILPIILISIFILSFKEKNKIKKLLKSYILFTLYLIMFLGIHYILKTPFNILSSGLSQSERIFYTILGYNMGNICIYLSVFIIGLMLFKYAFNMNLKISETNLTKVNLIYIMIMIFALSLSIVPTPSIYLISLPAFVVLMYDEKDIYKILIIYFMSICVVLLPMLSDYGDISLLFRIFTDESIWMNILNSLDTDTYIKVGNMIFTISVTSMLAYALYGSNKAKELMEEKNEAL